MIADFPDLIPIADLIALRPASYAFRIVIAISAFVASLNVESTVARVIGFVVVLLTGAGLLFVGITHGTVVDILLGVAGLAAAGYSWWFTRH
ncbi:hypothetical protein OKA05_01010 [Luteolibacter arcticus]|uniref:Uncharacterized protein n=1 Tax=Luteolibacter arcticus TaxID=1581411 RepID=A0ABT3GCE2_9BACT|nr:hypothetical protein [Luteolibacter arcticus]MCW1921111.1 hypothetical protein [Luteolibacter arcticus]